MAVRYREPAWKDKIDLLIGENQSQIDAILDAYGIPRLEAIRLTNDAGD